jgi:hypothetical protein
MPGPEADFVQQLAYDWAADEVVHITPQALAEIAKRAKATVEAFKAARG